MRYPSSLCVGILIRKINNKVINTAISIIETETSSAHARQIDDERNVLNQQHRGISEEVCGLIAHILLTLRYWNQACSLRIRLIKEFLLLLIGANEYLSLLLTTCRTSKFKICWSFHLLGTIRFPVPAK